VAKHSSAFVNIPVGIFAAAGLTWLLSHSERYWQAGAGIFLLAAIVGAIALDVLYGRFDPSNIKYFALCSYGIFLGVGMLLDLRDEAYAFDGRGIVLTLAGLLSFLLGFIWKYRPSELSRPGNSNISVSPEQLFKLSVFFYLLGFGALVAEWQFYGQLQSYSGRLVSITAELTPIPPTIHVWTQLVGPGSIMALVLLRHGTSWCKTVTLWIFLCLTVIWYVLSSGRSNFLALAIACLLVWLEVPDSRGSKKIGSTPIIVFCIATVVMLVLSVVRADWDFSRARADGVLGAEGVVRESLNIFRELCKTVEYFPRHMDYLHGYSFYGVVTNIVPRVWWPDKPIGVGRLASILYDYNSDNSIALSLPGELYANFGMLGSLVGMIFFGVLVRMIYRWYVRRRGDQAALVIYVFLVVTVIQEVRGDILDATMPLFYHLLPALLAFCAVAALNKSSTRKSQAKQRFAESSAAIRSSFRYRMDPQ
jgi:oligosaccharide repeat unit polymerase